MENYELCKSLKVINIENDFQFKTYKLESKSDMALYKKMLSLFYIDGGKEYTRVTLNLMSP